MGNVSPHDIIFAVAIYYTVHQFYCDNGVDEYKVMVASVDAVYTDSCSKVRQKFPTVSFLFSENTNGNSILALETLKRIVRSRWRSLWICDRTCRRDFPKSVSEMYPYTQLSLWLSFIFAFPRLLRTFFARCSCDLHDLRSRIFATFLSGRFLFKRSAWRIICRLKEID